MGAYSQAAKPITSANALNAYVLTCLVGTPLISATPHPLLTPPLFFSCNAVSLQVAYHPDGSSWPHVQTNNLF